MQTENTITLTGNPIPYRTWNHLRVNDCRIVLPTVFSSSPVLALPLLSDSIVCEHYMTTKVDKMARIPGGIGEEAYAFLDTQPRECLRISLSESPAAPLVFSVTPDDNAHLLMPYIVLESGVSATVIFDLRSPRACAGTLAQLISAHLEPGASLSLTILQTLGEGVTYLSDVAVMQRAGSSLSLLRADLGAKSSCLGFRATQCEADAVTESRLAYYGAHDNVLDINDDIIYLAPHGKGMMDVRGVLTEHAHKSYKGTLDLRRGCTDSEGNESESVLLLSDAAVNKTTPIILCGEEHVSANHAATVGRVDENALRYLSARGIPFEEARRMVVEGRLSALLRGISDDTVRAHITDYVSEVLADA